MYSLTFYKGSDPGVNTYEDWHLVPSSRPVVNPPSPKLISLDIPGANGSIDMTEVINDFVTYSDRSGSWEFIVLNDRTPAISWFDLYSNILNYLHGQRVKVYLNEEPDYYYEGRCRINSWQSNPDYSKIVIDYNLFPFKMEASLTNLNVTPSSSGVQLSINSNSMPVVPTFIVPSGVTDIKVVFKGHEYELPSGSSKNPDIVLEKGTNILTFKGSENQVQVTFRGGKL